VRNLTNNYYIEKYVSASLFNLPFHYLRSCIEEVS